MSRTLMQYNPSPKKAALDGVLMALLAPVFLAKDAGEKAKAAGSLLQMPLNIFKYGVGGYVDAGRLYKAQPTHASKNAILEFGVFGGGSEAKAARAEAALTDKKGYERLPNISFASPL